MRKTRHTEAMMTAIAETGEAYRSDVALYMDSVFGKKGVGTKELRKWEEAGYLTPRQIPKEKNNGQGNNLYIATTPALKGINFIVDNEWLGDWKTTKQLVDDNMSDFDTNQMERVRVRLMYNRCKLSFEAIGCLAFTTSKPNLCEMYNKLSKEKIKETNIKYACVRNRELYAQMNEEECKEALEAGIFYTMPEVREFIECVGMEGNADVSMESRMRGIFISDTNCYAVYTTQRSGGNNFTVINRTEEYVLNVIKNKLLRYTNVDRELKNIMCKYREYGKTVSECEQNGIDALVITASDESVVKMSKPLEIGFRKSLVGNTALYKHVYMIPFTAEGMYSLNLLCNQTKEELREQGRKDLLATKRMNITDNDKVLFAVESDTNISFAYMPVYELNALNQIKNKKEYTGIMLYKDMQKAVSRVVGSKTKYYSIGKKREITNDKGKELGVYGENGNLLGKEMILNYMRGKKLTADLNEINKVYEKYGYDRAEEFFNAIAEHRDGVPSVERIVNELESLKEYKRKVNKTDTLSLSLPPEFKKEIKKAAKLYNTTVNRYITKLIEERVKADAVRYDEIMKEDIAARKGK